MIRVSGIGRKQTFLALHGAEHVHDKAGEFECCDYGGAEVQTHFSNTFRAMIGLRTIGDGLVDQLIQITGRVKTEILNAITPIYL